MNYFRTTLIVGFFLFWGIWTFRTASHTRKVDTGNNIKQVSWYTQDGDVCAWVYDSDNGAWRADVFYRWPSPSKYFPTKEGAVAWVDGICKP